MDPPSAHDALFKATFSDVQHAASELRHVLPPALAARLDFGTLANEPGSFVDGALKERHTDLLFSVRTVADDLVLLYLLFEHQSTVDRLMPFRLLRYMVRIWESHLTAHPEAKRLPPVVPVVLHHSDSGWTAGTAFTDVLDVDPDTRQALGAHVPSFAFLLDDISHESDDALRARAMTALARLCLWCLRHAREPDELVQQLGRWLHLVREARLAPNGVAAIVRIWKYILATNQPPRPEVLVQRLLAVAGQEEKEEIVTAADQLIERGRQEGLREGLRATVQKLLRLRFGALSDDVTMRIARADTVQLEQWVERVLTAATLSEVLGEP